MSYRDASTLTKLHFPEPDSARFRRFAAASPDRPLTGRIGALELERVAWFKAATGQCTPAKRDAVLDNLALDMSLGDLRIVEWDDSTDAEYAEVLRICYGQTPPVTVRTADAMHLAAARLAGETELVSTDARQRTAALACGLTLFPPVTVG